MIPPELSGQVDQLGTPLALFMVAIGIFLTAMAGFRTPVIALMPDLTPSPLRSQANGIINLMGGVGTLIATLGSGFLYGMGRMVPFALRRRADGGRGADAVLLRQGATREFEAAAHEEEGLGCAARHQAGVAGGSPQPVTS